MKLTVVAITGIDKEAHERAIQQTCACLPMASIAVLHWVEGMTHKAYNRFVMHELGSVVETDLCIVVQSDGFALHPDRWQDAFMEYDYIGAPWMHGEQGNGGFSLRSRKFMKYAAMLPDTDTPEDALCCQCGYRRKFMERMGVRFAPLDLAHRFSHEHPIPEHPGWTLRDSFGFHGKHHLK